MVSITHYILKAMSLKNGCEYGNSKWGMNSKNRGRSNEPPTVSVQFASQLRLMSS